MCQPRFGSNVDAGGSLIKFRAASPNDALHLPLCQQRGGQDHPANVGRVDPAGGLDPIEYGILVARGR
jgi:hypothetical protein